MYNTKFIDLNGNDVYPGYLDKDKRSELKERYGVTKGYLKCGCRPNDNLYYRISEDLRIYPEHNNYLHDKNCCRYQDPTGKKERQTAYEIDDQSGDVTAFITFNPKTFNYDDNDVEKEENNIAPEETNDSEEEIIIENESDQVQQKEKKEPKLSLGELIRCINVDAYSEKILNNKLIDSKENFSKFVYYRMKRIRISRMRKSLGDLTLEKDGVRFFYLPVVEVVKNEQLALTKCYVKTLAPDGKVYSNFIYQKTLDKAVKEYVNTYGIEPDQSTMVAGFQYLKKGVRSKKTYRVLGRIHFFRTSSIGIYSRSITEMAVYDRLHELTEEDPNIRFFIPPDDATISGLVEIKNRMKKILLVCQSRKKERVSFDSSLYVPLIGSDAISKDDLYKLLT